MTIFEWLIFFVLVQLIHGLGTWKLYLKSGYRGFYALIPVFNAFILMKSKEGQIITFPGCLLHKSEPVANERKTIISFNSWFTY